MATKPQARNKFSIYSQPLPLQTYPLPTFIPHNPISLLQIAWALLSELIYPPSIHPHTARSLRKLSRGKRKDETYTAYLDAVTQTIQVTDQKATRALWERGFFGKGSLSRSEPEWVARVIEARRLAEEERRGRRMGKTAAEVTEERRRERKEAKRERARKEVEVLEEVLKSERGVKSDTVDVESMVEEKEVKIVSSAQIDPSEAIGATELLALQTPGQTQELEGEQKPGVDSGVDVVETITVEAVSVADSRPLEVPSTHPPSTTTPFQDEEHLQLAPQEAFFLAYGLGIVSVVDGISRKTLSIPDVLRNLCASSTFPPKQTCEPAQDPANNFMVSYAVYHHFRSLGWVVRPGIKFSVDFLLYARGPVFAHAQFAVMILPSFTHPYWSETPERREMKRQAERKDWWWFHCVNRVQGQVLKSLVLCYVEVPPPMEATVEMDVGALLRRYRVREFVIKRWAPQRNLK